MPCVQARQGGEQWRHPKRTSSQQSPRAACWEDLGVAYIGDCVHEPPCCSKMKKPAAMLAVANQGLARGLRRYEQMDDQSSPIAPMPRPWRPEPSCWASTELGMIQQIQEREVSIWNR